MIHFKSWWNLSESERTGVLSLPIAAHQVEYAGTIQAAIEKLGPSNQDDKAALAIFSDTTLIGFVVLSRRQQLPQWARQGMVALTAMRIDQRLQGKGLGVQALMELSNWLAKHWPESESIGLVVDEDNQAGIRAYTRAGFKKFGQREQGRIGWVLYMDKPLTA